jgi:superfamily II DNA or RNA helicase
MVDPMARALRLRPWQKAALEQFEASGRTDFLAVATPGAGKTTFALTAAVRFLVDHPERRVIVVAPTRHLKTQWATAAARLDLHLEPQWSSRDGALPADMHGVVVTYQQVATSPRALLSLARDAFVVFDELHHAGDERSWGDGVRTAFDEAARRLAISGTPFRSDTNAIPFVHYDDFGEAHCDFEYGYGAALGDGGVVRPVHFPRIDGQMDWVAPDGTENSHTFDDALDAARSSQRLRTALSLSGEWLPTVLDQAHAQLTAIRHQQPQAGGLVIAVDQEHARGIVSMMRRRLRVHAVLALSDDPDASDRIEQFAAGQMPWIVAVRMVSEGVDIPRLRVGVFATTTATELFFRQATGRLVRWTPGMRHQKSYFFIPDDPRLRSFASQIAQQRRHSLRRRDADDERAGDDAGLDALPAEGPDAEQLSLFSALSAVTIGDAHETEHMDEPGAGELIFDEPEPDDALLVSLTPPPRPGSAAGGTATAVLDAPSGTRRQHKAELRAANAEGARDIVRSTGLSHAQVNGELNRLASVARVSEATVDQLVRRAQAAQRWLDRL